MAGRNRAVAFIDVVACGSTSSEASVAIASVQKDVEM